MNTRGAAALAGEPHAVSDAPPASVAIRLSHVVREYAAREDPGAGTPCVRAVDGVSFEVARGERVAVVGPSGSGKSTLLHLMAGIDTPTSGEVWLAGRELSRLADDDLTQHRRNTVGLVFQAFHLLAGLSARENVALPALLAGDAERCVLARADALLDEVGLAERRFAAPQTLSGGEMQRVALARALIREPRVLLADEPTGNLDSRSAARVLGMIMDVSLRHGATVVLVTHSTDAAAMAERVIEIRDGHITGDERQTAAPAPRDP